MKVNHTKRKCTGTNRAGKPCNNWAIRGGFVCKNHGGLAPQVLGAANVRAEIEAWGLGDTTTDPGETLLRLITQSANRAERYAAEVQLVVDQHGLQEALVGESFIFNEDSKTLQKVGEYIRGLAALENQERDRCAKFAVLAINAGLAERQVKLAERQGLLIEQVLSAVFADIGLTEQQRALAPDAIRRAIGAA